MRVSSGFRMSPWLTLFPACETTSRISICTLFQELTSHTTLSLLRVNSTWPMLTTMISSQSRRSLCQVCLGVEMRCCGTSMCTLPSGMVKEVTGGYVVSYHPVEDDPDKVFEVDFSPPFRRVRCVQYRSPLTICLPFSPVPPHVFLIFAIQNDS